MPRSLSTRTHVRTHTNRVLAAVKRQVGNLQGVWTSRSTTHEAYIDETGRRNGRQVPRPAADYAENDLNALATTITSLDDMIEGLSILRQQLTSTYFEIKTENDDNAAIRRAA